MIRFSLLLTAGLTVLATPAFADETNCPLHARLDAQKVTQTASLVPSVAPVVVSPDANRISTSTPPLRLPTTPRGMSPKSVVTVERGVDTPPIIKDAPVLTAQNSYGSGTKAPIAASSPHAAWTSVLQNYVSSPDAQGLTHFAYGKLKANRADKAKLDSYINSLEATNPDTLSENEAIAYYANLYNAVTIQVVTDNYPVKSIRKIGSLTSGPWKKNLFTVNGNPTSLDTVEHKILRVKYPSPYVHYMVNCASVGCPNLLDSAWEASTLKAERKKAARAYVNSPRGVQITSKGLKISSIYKWFKDDFGGKEGVLKHIREYADADLAAAIDSGAKIKGYHYDWSLNE